MQQNFLTLPVNNFGGKKSACYSRVLIVTELVESGTQCKSLKSGQSAIVNVSITLVPIPSLIKVKFKVHSLSKSDRDRERECYCLIFVPA